MVAGSAAQVEAARRRPDTLAVLDLTVGSLLAVRSGTLTLTVAAGGRTASSPVTLG